MLVRHCGVLLLHDDPTTRALFSPVLDFPLSGSSGRVEEEVFKVAGGTPFNLASPQKLGDALQGLGAELEEKKRTGRVSTSESVLNNLILNKETPEAVREVSRLSLEHRGLSKLRNTYLVGLSKAVDNKDGRIHAQIHQTVAATGRLSMSHPNLQVEKRERIIELLSSSVEGCDGRGLITPRWDGRFVLWVFVDFFFLSGSFHSQFRLGTTTEGAFARRLLRNLDTFLSALTTSRSNCGSLLHLVATNRCRMDSAVAMMYTPSRQGSSLACRRT